MPVCEICGKELAYPKSKGHINSKFHQDALKSGNKEPGIVKVEKENILEAKEAKTQSKDVKKEAVKITATKKAVTKTPKKKPENKPKVESKPAKKKGFLSKFKRKK